jgi:hypothetical protein
VHDWDEYAAKRIERHEKTQARKQAWRTKSGRPAEREKAPDATSGATSGKPDATSGATSPTRARYQPDQQGLRPLPDQPQTPSAPDADAQGPAGTASAPSQSQAPPPQWEEIAPGQHRGTPNGEGEVTLLKVRCSRCERSMPIAEWEEHVCELVPGDPVQPLSRPGNLAGFLPRRRGRRQSAQDAAAEEQLQRMASNRPTSEQIAAEAARLGLVPHDA